MIRFPLLPCVLCAVFIGILGGASRVVADGGPCGAGERLATLSGAAISFERPLDDNAPTLQSGTPICLTRHVDYMTGDLLVHPVGNSTAFLANSNAIEPGDTLPHNPLAFRPRPQLASTDDPETAILRRNLLTDCQQTSQHCTNINVSETFPSSGGVEGNGDHGGVEGNGVRGGVEGNGLHGGVEGNGKGTLLDGPIASLQGGGLTGGTRLALNNLGSISDSPSLRSLGGTFNGAALLQPLEPEHLQRIQTVARAADDAAGLDLVQAAADRREAIQRAAVSDQATLASYYKGVPAQELAARMGRASASLQQEADLFAQSSGGMEPSQRLWFKNVYQNAADKAATAQAALGSAQDGDVAPNPFSLLGAPARAPGDSLAAKVADIFGLGQNGLVPTTNDALEARMVMLDGLPAADQRSALGNLELSESHTLDVAGGGRKTVNVLHNGYVLGAGKTSMDCSSFISLLFTVDGRKVRFTTTDLRAIYELRYTGEMPNPPSYSRPQEQLIRKAASGFTALDLYGGDTIRPGDILIHRLPWKPIGHTMLVTSYNPMTMVAEVTEATQSSGTVVGPHRFSLSIDAVRSPMRFVRPGLMALRLSRHDSGTCRYSR